MCLRTIILTAALVSFFIFINPVYACPAQNNQGANALSRPSSTSSTTTALPSSNSDSTSSFLLQLPQVSAQHGQFAYGVWFRITSEKNNPAVPSHAKVLIRPSLHRFPIDKIPAVSDPETFFSQTTYEFHVLLSFRTEYQAQCISLDASKSEKALYDIEHAVRPFSFHRAAPEESRRAPLALKYIGIIPPACVPALQRVMQDWVGNNGGDGYWYRWAGCFEFVAEAVERLWMECGLVVGAEYKNVAEVVGEIRGYKHAYGEYWREVGWESK